MCIYENKEESYAAFKKIWLNVYGDRLPTTADAVKWTGNDSPQTWLNNVYYYYNLI